MRDFHFGVNFFLTFSVIIQVNLVDKYSPKKSVEPGIGTSTPLVEIARRVELESPSATLVHPRSLTDEFADILDIVVLVFYMF